MTTSWARHEGTPFPLGLSWQEKQRAYNFALYSKHAESVELRFYSSDDFHTPLRIFDFQPLKNKSSTIWHCRLSEDYLEGCRYYAYRITGPAPRPGFAWHTFDPEKLLVDPYARAVFFPPDFDRDAAIGPGSNEGKAPLSVLFTCPADFQWGKETHSVHGSDLIIYEMHVRGFTLDPSSGVPTAHRGTFRGVIDKIPYLKELGVTAIELMPIFQFDASDGQYWGYMPLAFFAPHNGYSSQPESCTQHEDFREMVRALHEAGIEIILDVVYNHTAEGDERGPVFSFKGIDNSTYYALSDDPDASYQNFSGTGNTLHTMNRAVRQLITDSLRYWVKEMHVDGFRFDLASVFTRDAKGAISLSDPPIFGQISADPDLAKIRLIAEPWDAGGAYQLGAKFPGQLWMQWNGRYRDTVRRFIRGDAGMVPDLMTRLYGSSDLFPDDLMNACRPWQSINYVTAHDGFTIYDLVSYTKKHNWANGHKNADGQDEISMNCGWEGDQQVPQHVVALRKQQIKNFFCLLLLSNGTPMIRMGDEFLHTQQGNNNPYNQDNETSWLDWQRLDEHQDMFRFLKHLIAFRKAHPSIARSRFWRDDVTWYGADHAVDLSPTSRQLAFCLHGAEQADQDLYVMINGGDQPRCFGIFEGVPNQWARQIDTSKAAPDDFVTSPYQPLRSMRYDVQAHSIVVLVRAAHSAQP